MRKFISLGVMDEFRFRSSPVLTVVIELTPYHILSVIDDADAVGGRRVEYTGSINNIVNYFAKAMNFT